MGGCVAGNRIYLCQTVSLTHAVHGGRFVKAFPANGAKAPLVMRGLRPAVRHRVLDDARRDARAGCHHVRHAALVHNEVAYWVREEESTIKTNAIC